MFILLGRPILVIVVLRMLVVFLIRARLANKAGLGRVCLLCPLRLVLAV
jgi:hypothetical protein